VSVRVSSRTPEGEPNLCPVCGALICVEPSTPSCDGPCPSCGVLLWFLRTSTGVRLYEINRIAAVRERIANILARTLHVGKEELERRVRSFEELRMDSLDIVELVMELEEELGFTIPDAEARRLRTVADLVDWLVRHLR
jgi:acyl carrier protein